MKVRRLQIESQQMARIGIEMQMARLNVDMKMRRMRVDDQNPEMSLERVNPSLDVDMTRLRNNLGMKDINTLTRELGTRAVEHAQQAIKNIENNGDNVAKMPRSGNPIAQIARTAMLREKRPLPVGTGDMDGTVDIKSDPGSINIDWSIHDMSITWDDYQSPIITIEPKPSVDIMIEQEPHLKFKVIEQTYPPESGRAIDEEI